MIRALRLHRRGRWFNPSGRTSIFKKSMRTIINKIIKTRQNQKKKKNLKSEYTEELIKQEKAKIQNIRDTEKEVKKEWSEIDYEEGQLSIDVYQLEDRIVIKSTIAGVRPEDIDISINNDMLTIKGRRQNIEKIDERNYLYRECYWGSFSRSIILPIEIKPDKIEANLENGILSVVLPKAKPRREVEIKVQEKKC